jgi:hypothetical protein
MFSHKQDSAGSGSGRSIFVRYVAQRLGLLAASLITGFIVGIAYRSLIDDAHWARDSEIGSVIEQESVKWDRFLIRCSDNHLGPRTSHVIADKGEQGKHPLGTVCPADHTRPQVTCGSCALCINSTGPVVFKAH